MVGAGAVKAGEDLLLQVEVLEHGLDDEVGVGGDVLVPDHPGDLALDLLCLLGPEDPPLYCLVQEAIDDLVTPVDPFLLPVYHLYGESLRCALLGYPRAHGPGTNYSHSANFHEIPRVLQEIRRANLLGHMQPEQTGTASASGRRAQGSM